MLHTDRKVSARFAGFSYKTTFIKKGSKNTKNFQKFQFYDQILLKYVRYHSSRDLGPKFSVLLKMQAFKVKVAKKWSLY